MSLELKNLDEVRQAIAVLVTNNMDALDRLVWTGVFGTGEVRDAAARGRVRHCKSVGICPASIHNLYMARGRGEVPATFTVPAINIRGITYDTARCSAPLGARRRRRADRIARSEISYTDQRPLEYTFVLLSAALREGWRGPVFIGATTSRSTPSFTRRTRAEMQTVLDLSAEALKAGFYNIDVDTSTLVDLDKPARRSS